jgi:hypothetical protein
MDESPNPSETRIRGRNWTIFRCPDKKGLPGAPSGRRLEMLLVPVGTLHACRSQLGEEIGKPLITLGVIVEHISII